MKKFSDKELDTTLVDSIDRPNPNPASPLELRIDDKGYIYSKHRNHKLPVDDEEFAQYCQMLGCIALMEMRELERVLH